jgi:lon-related putative ATP-dependent protease
MTSKKNFEVFAVFVVCFAIEANQMHANALKVSVDRLRWKCDPAAYAFQSTAEIPPMKGFVEQERPVRAIRFGLDITSPGYNIYVSGLTGTGKSTVIKQFLDEIAASMPIPDDWLYVHNFRDPNAPLAMSLPAGLAKVLQQEMDELVQHLKTEIPKAFESKEYEQSMNALITENQEGQQTLFNALSEKARMQGFAIEVTKVGVNLVPIVEAKPITAEQLEALDAETRHEMERRRTALQEDIAGFLRQVRDLNKASREKISDLNRQVGRWVVGPRMEVFREVFGAFPRVLSYLSDVQDYVLSHMEDFTEDGQKQQESSSPQLRLEAPQDGYLKCRVNIVVDNTGLQGAPVVIETNPTYYNLYGRVERKAQFGTLTSDFTTIQAGAYLKANGGFLVVNANDVLMNFGAWETLKRTVKNNEVRIEDLSEQYGMVPVVGMRPSPIPVSVKVIMIGNQGTYHLLYAADEDFRKIFKVKADFDAEMERDERALHNYAAFVSTRCHEEKLLPFDPSGVSEVAEYGARLVDDQSKLSARFSDVADIVREASYWARRNGKEIVQGGDVRRAVDEKYYRSNLVEERIHQLFRDGTLLVDVDGEKIGQVNGLAVIDLGDIRFGKPSRITAKTFVGKSGVIDVERESKLSGKIYEKGVLVLTGYLASEYAQERPLSLGASICFEQSYEGVDGDSASSTEIYALLSSLARAPIRQGIAVTGSVNQHGEIQPIGGVNQKIEGFYDVCRSLGLTGNQGVIIPIQNVRNLMLRPELVEEVRAGRFHVYAVSNVKEGIEILTGVPAEEIHHRVEQRLQAISEGLRKSGDQATTEAQRAQSNS